MKIPGIKGMNDILPSEIGRWLTIERLARQVFDLYGYREVRTPVVEAAALYARGVGEATDIVKKEMYAFEDKGGDLLALRPEGTAGVVRAFIEHGCHVEGPQKWFYAGPMFRRERPQKGRYRQFQQIGCEAFGVAEPGVDVEQIAMLADLFGRLGIRADLDLQVNSVGDPACRPAYLADLRAYFSERHKDLCADCNERIERNPFRVLDCKVPSCQPVLEAAPRLLDRLCPACQDHFAAVRSGLDALGVQHTVNTRLVRGLDYYTRTAFEAIPVSPRLAGETIGAQSTLVGGGRYDGLVEKLGGQPTPAVGFAMGVNRWVMVLEALERAGARPASIPVGPELFFIAADAAGALEALRIADRLRKAGIPCDLDARGGKMKAQFRQAERVGARFALVLGETEVASRQAKLKDMATRVETPVGLDELQGRLAAIA